MIDKEEMIIKGCMFAVNEMVGGGSVKFAHRKGDKWGIIDWREILDYLDNKLKEKEIKDGSNNN